MHTLSANQNLVYLMRCTPGVAMYGVLLGSITSLIQREDLGVIQFEEKMAQMAQYLRGRGVSRELRLRTKMYFDKMYPQRVLCDERTVLHLLPEKLRDDVRLDMYEDQIDAIPFVPDPDQMESEELKAEWRPIRLALAAAMVPLSYMREEKIAYSGTRSNAMYIIVNGVVQVHARKTGRTTQRNHQVDHIVLGVCDCFGELSVLRRNRGWRADIVAAAFCSLLRLDQHNVDRLRSRFISFDEYVTEYTNSHHHFDLQRSQDEQVRATRAVVKVEAALPHKRPSFWLK